MKRLAGYLLAALILPFFGRFQEVVISQNGTTVQRAALYGQKVGVALGLTGIAFAIVYHLRERSRGESQFGWSRCLGVGLFALPALWQHETVARFERDGLTTEIMSGTGGPWANVFFAVAAFAFIAMETALRAHDRQILTPPLPRDRPSPILRSP